MEQYLVRQARAYKPGKDIFFLLGMTIRSASISSNIFLMSSISLLLGIERARMYSCGSVLYNTVAMTSGLFL